MSGNFPGKWAVVVVDMTVDNVGTGLHGGIEEEARKILPGIREAVKDAHRRGYPVVYACDSFLSEDLIFKSRMKPHCLRGTEGAQVTSELPLEPGDIFLEKRSFSAFFRTDLDLTLRSYGVNTIIVAGISTLICILATAFEAVSNGFSAVMLSDCSAAHTPQAHEKILSLYRNTPIKPVLSVMSFKEFIQLSCE